MELADDASPAQERDVLPAGRLSARRFWIPLAAGGIVLLADQLTKALIRAWIGPAAANHRVDLAGSFVAFAYVQNPGAAFGLLRGQTAFLILAASAIVALLLLSLRGTQRCSALMYVGLGLLLGGALGNLIDRVRLGYVTDFIALGIWPKFNVADSAITVGLILLAWSYLVNEGGTGETSAAPDHGRGSHRREAS